MILIFTLIFTMIAYTQEYQKLHCKVKESNLNELAILLQSGHKVRKYLDYMAKGKFKYRCNLDLIKNKKEVIIAFDGSNAFKPYEFEVNQISSRFDDEESRHLKYSRNIWKHSDKIQNKLDKERSGKSGSPLSYLLQYGQASHNKFYYFSHMHFRKGLKCIREIKKINPSIKLKIISYSWGGNTVQKVANKLEKEKIQITSILTIDPVRKGFLALGVIRNITSNSNSLFFKKNKNVTKHYNIFQKTDDGSLGFIKIKGNSILSADKNIPLSEIYKDKRPTHINLIYFPELFKLYNNFLTD